MNFHEELADRTAWTENVVKTFLPEESGTQKAIMEAMNYSVMAGGKRLRPLLMHETLILLYMMIFQPWTMTSIGEEN